MNKYLAGVVLLLATACDDVASVYPGDARSDLYDHTCANPTLGYEFTFTGQNLTVVELGTNNTLTAEAVGATGNEVLFKINPNGNVRWGEIVYAPSLSTFTFMRVVIGDHDFFDKSLFITAPFYCE